MDFSLLLGALSVLMHLSIPIAVVVVVAAALGGILRVSTQIDDSAISFVAKAFAIYVLLYLSYPTYSAKIVDFTKNVWGSVESFK